MSRFLVDIKELIMFYIMLYYVSVFKGLNLYILSYWPIKIS